MIFFSSFIEWLVDCGIANCYVYYIYEVVFALQTLEFAELDTCRVHFLRHALTPILTSNDERVITQVFSRISPLQKLATLKDGLRLFMRHFLLRGPDAETLRPKV